MDQTFWSTASPRTTFSLLRYLIPHARRRLRSRYFDFRHDILSYYRQRAQSRIYHFLAARSRRKAASPKRGLFGLVLRGRSRRVVLGNATRDNAGLGRGGAMTEQGDAAGPLTYGGYYGSEGRERGARRRKLAGYLRAANELRQSYQQAAGSAWANAGSDEVGNDTNEPGSYPDVSMVRAGSEEMVIFPSYARRHVKRQQRSGDEVDPGQGRALEHGVASAQGPTVGEGTSSRQSLNSHEEDDDDAVVDVDIRGCVYAPHRGPLTRKSRLLIGLARQLSGIPAPSASAQNDTEGYQSSDDGVGRYGRTDSTLSQNEEELVSREAQSIAKKGELEARVGGSGKYSEELDIYRTTSSSSAAKLQVDSKPTDASSVSSRGSGIEQRAISKRASWNQPADMSAAELLVANNNLMTRLKPFLNTPIANVPITIFFYNEKQSQSRTTFTNDAGHFVVRAALNFVPTDVRVIASESLSVSEKVQITEPKGISLISDIDDTIKHSAIGSGAREIFRNTFVRELTDLTIEGVKEWYKQLASMGVHLHYVSNSPWQLYPLLVKFFALEGLPPGSFHLKQYSGMLQGIFEPVAERKKGNLESIMRDFPERKFLLVGDSGEADLEVYTDVVLANPGRIIGVYIRDVTTSKIQGFFDPSIGGAQRAKRGSERDTSAIHTEAGEGGRPSPASRRQPNEPTVGNLVDLEEDKSATDYSPKVASSASRRQPSQPAVGKLIDLEEDRSTTNDAKTASSTARRQPTEEDRSTTHHPRAASSAIAPGHSRRLPLRPRRRSTILAPAPAPPKKPTALRTSMTNENLTQTSVKTRPAIPPKPQRLSEDTLSSTHKASAVTNSSQSSNNNKPPFQTTTTQTGYGPAIRQRVSTVYNRLPSATHVLRNRLQPPTTQQPPTVSTPTGPSTKLPPPPPPPPPPPIRRAITSYPYPSLSGSSTTTSNSNNNTATVVGGPSTETLLNKKEELWNRRWARAQEILSRHGVELRSWRVGTDVLGHSTQLVERVLREMDRVEKGVENDDDDDDDDNDGSQRQAAER
ncbi:MAG: hypothetical protein M1816_001252 [Peltula sp. TS41687]|nr:MAG: hypothetical protein M1816_001252 [Peltula sp. TS41687]